MMSSTPLTRKLLQVVPGINHTHNPMMDFIGYSKRTQQKTMTANNGVAEIAPSLLWLLACGCVRSQKMSNRVKTRPQCGLWLVDSQKRNERPQIVSSRSLRSHKDE